MEIPLLYMVCSHVKNPHTDDEGTSVVTHSIYKTQQDAKHMIDFLNAQEKSKVGFLAGYADADYRTYYFQPIERETTFGESLPSWAEDIKEINRQIEHLYKEMSEGEVFAEEEHDKPAG